MGMLVRWWLIPSTAPHRNTQTGELEEEEEEEEEEGPFTAAAIPPQQPSSSSGRGRPPRAPSTTAQPPPPPPPPPARRARKDALFHFPFVDAEGHVEGLLSGPAAGVVVGGGGDQGEGRGLLMAGGAEQVLYDLEPREQERRARKVKGGGLS